MHLQQTAIDEGKPQPRPEEELHLEEEKKPKYYVVTSYHGNRRLHYTIGCWRVPGVDVMNFEWVTNPKEAIYHAYCKQCWPDKKKSASSSSTGIDDPLRSSTHRSELLAQAGITIKDEEEEADALEAAAEDEVSSGDESSSSSGTEDKTDLDRIMEVEAVTAEEKVGPPA